MDILDSGRPATFVLFHVNVLTSYTLETHFWKRSVDQARPTATEISTLNILFH